MSTQGQATREITSKSKINTLKIECFDITNQIKIGQAQIKQLDQEHNNRVIKINDLLKKIEAEKTVE